MSPLVVFFQVALVSVLSCDSFAETSLHGLDESYQSVARHLEFGKLPVSNVRVEYASLSPFCTGFVSPEPTEGYEPECVQWAEQELDMLLMYLDLRKSGLREKLAISFYEEIRCLSRANIKVVDGGWSVCFSYDFSEVVGNLLAEYVLQDAALQKGSDVLVNSARLLTHGGYYLQSLYGSRAMYYIYPNMILSTSCCRRCTNSNYFVNVEEGECLRNPFGTHCCHSACKSLGRLRVGVSSSTRYCCSQCWPMRCAL